MDRLRTSTRELTAEEVELWRTVTATVHPRDPRKLVSPLPTRPRHQSFEPESKRSEQGVQKREQKLKPLATIDRRLQRELTKGRLEIDARLDLHGRRLADAHHVVLTFLRQAQDDGARVALIVTGKGERGARADTWPNGGERGVLKRQVPFWLADPRLRHIVAGFGEAGKSHGGAGALYVRIRRRGRTER